MLLDIKVKEPDLALLARGKVVYEAPRFMSVGQAARQLLEVEAERAEGVCGPEALAVGVARLGSEGERIVAGTLGELAEADLGEPLQSLVLCGRRMHEMEWEFVRGFAGDVEGFDRVWRRDYAGGA